MEKKIKVNVEKNKQRITIPTDNGTIIVRNPSQELKNELVDELTKAVMKNEDFDERKIMLRLIDDCTNVEFDKNVFEVENLSHEARMITNEILLIFQEIISETYQIINLILQQVKNEELQNELLEEKNEIEKMVVEKENKKEEVEEVQEVQEVEKREVRKPQRRRKR